MELYFHRKTQDKIKLAEWLQILKINERWELEVGKGYYCKELY